MPNLTSIGERAFGFYYSYNSESGTGIFIYCTSLKSIGNVPKLEKIASIAFAGCNTLETIGDLRSVTSIGESAFSNCDNLTLRVLPNSYAEQYAKENNIKYTYIED